jgi:Tfp pilus assembly protein PilO
MSDTKKAKGKLQGKLQGKAAIGLIIGGDLLLLLLGWFMLIGPQRATVTSIVQATAAAEVQIQAAKQPVKIVKPAAIVQPEIKTADLYSLAKAMPSTADMPNLLLQLDQIARSSGVKLSSISPGPASPTGAFNTLAINLSFSGDFYSLTDMLYRLRSLVSVHNGALNTTGRLFSIGSVGLTPTGVGADLNATVIVDAYVYGGAPVTPVVAPAPASTDTTSTPTSTAPSADVAPKP